MYVKLVTSERASCMLVRKLQLFATLWLESLACSLMSKFNMSLRMQCLQKWQGVHWPKATSATIQCRYSALSVLGSVLAYLVAALSPTMDVANGALPAYVVTLLFFVGLLIRADDQPAYWHW